jgi:hypothetical protein
VVECAGLEIQCTGLPYRRFESDPLRHIRNRIKQLRDAVAKMRPRNRGYFFVLWVEMCGILVRFASLVCSNLPRLGGIRISGDVLLRCGRRRSALEN